MKLKLCNTRPVRRAEVLAGAKAKAAGVGVTVTLGEPTDDTAVWLNLSDEGTSTALAAEEIESWWFRSGRHATAA